MKISLNKIFLPILLVILTGGLEIMGIFLCRSIIPDGKNEIISEKRENITKLMFVDSEDQSRFYPWLEYDKDECISIENFLKLYTDHFADEDLKARYNDEILNNASLGEDEGFLDSAKVEEKIREFMYVLLNDKIKGIVSVFDSDFLIDKDADFLKGACCDYNNAVLYIKDFSLKDNDGNSKLLDLVMKIDSQSLLYYRLRSSKTRTVSSSEISRKSAGLISDVQEVFEEYYLFFPPYDDYESEEYYAEEEKYSDSFSEFSASPLRYTEEKQIADYTNNEIEDFLISADKNGNLLDVFNEYESLITYSIEPINTETEYSEVMSELGACVNYLNFRISIPNEIFESEYNVFSVGDELMIVFDCKSLSKGFDNVIVYYSMTDGKVTGFSIGSADWIS